VKVPLPQDEDGRAICPHCRTPLLKLRRKRRVVEDLMPPQVQATCYHTQSGYCPGCRRRVESRAPEQPPAANLPHAQLGINALATAAVLRLENRLPFRQITQLFSDVVNLKLCPGAVSRQIRRLARWFNGEHGQLALRLRKSNAVHADETGWRTNGRNGWLWTICDARHTLYHVDNSRGGAVIRQLLGEAFGGTLVSDFYGALTTRSTANSKSA
jgi:transposase